MFEYPVASPAPTTVAPPTSNIGDRAVARMLSELMIAESAGHAATVVRERRLDSAPVSSSAWMASVFAVIGDRFARIVPPLDRQRSFAVRAGRTERQRTRNQDDAREQPPRPRDPPKRNRYNDCYNESRYNRRPNERSPRMCASLITSRNRRAGAAFGY